MENAFTQLGFSDPTQMMFSASLGQEIERFTWKSIPGFVYGQAAATLVWGHFSRKWSREEAKKRIEDLRKLDEFQSRVMQERNQTEIDFMYKMFRDGISFQREYSKQLLNSRRLQDEFEYFCNITWCPRFKTSITDIFDKHNTPVLNSKGGIKINLLLARTKTLQSLNPRWGIDLKENYNNFSEDFIDFIGKHEQFNTMWLRIWEKPSLSDVSDSMNIFYIMQGLPTIILFLNESHNRLSIDATLWGFQVGHSNLIMDRIIESNFTDANKESVALQLLTAATSFLCDCFNEPMKQFDERLFEKIKRKISNNDILETISKQYEKLDNLQTLPLLANFNGNSQNQ